jgi:hypothetical protein
MVREANISPQILQYLTLQELFQAQRVSRLFQAHIQSSLILRRIMFLAPSAPSLTVIPLRVVDTPLRGKIPRTKIIWVKRPHIAPGQLTSHLMPGGSGCMPAAVLEALYARDDLPRPTLNPILNYRVINWKLDTIMLKSSPVSHADRGLRLAPRTIDASFNDSRRNMLITQPPVVDVVVGRSDTLWGLYEAHNETGVTVGDVLDAEERLHDPQRRGGGTAVVGWV